MQSYLPAILSDSLNFSYVFLFVSLTVLGLSGVNVLKFYLHKENYSDSDFLSFLYTRLPNGLKNSLSDINSPLNISSIMGRSAFTNSQIKSNMHKILINNTEFFVKYPFFPYKFSDEEKDSFLSFIRSQKFGYDIYTTVNGSIRVTSNTNIKNLPFPNPKCFYLTLDKNTHTVWYESFYFTPAHLSSFYRNKGMRQAHQALYQFIKNDVDVFTEDLTAVLQQNIVSGKTNIDLIKNDWFSFWYYFLKVYPSSFIFNVDAFYKHNVSILKHCVNYRGGNNPNGNPLPSFIVVLILTTIINLYLWRDYFYIKYVFIKHYMINFFNYK